MSGERRVTRGGQTFPSAQRGFRRFETTHCMGFQNECLMLQLLIPIIVEIGSYNRFSCSQSQSKEFVA